MTRPTQPSPSKDWTKDAAALELCDQIASYWRDRGHAIEVFTEQYHDGPARGPRFAIRSNMVNGQPREVCHG